MMINDIIDDSINDINYYYCVCINSIINCDNDIKISIIIDIDEWYW